MIDHEQAVAIAREAATAHLELHEGEPITVEGEDGRLVVTFVHILPPGWRGPDYDARVTLDAATGEVLEILAGS